MAPVHVLFLSIVLFATDVEAQNNHFEAENNHSKIITLGSSISPNGNRTSWVSTSGRFAFGFYQQGNGFAVGIWLVGKTEDTVVWTANRDYPPVSSNSTVELTKDGKLLLRTEEEKEVPIADISSPTASASMLDTGNFVLYGHRFNDTPLWQSFDFPTDTILGGQNLSLVKNLVSSMSKLDHSSGRFSLSVDDGNLVAYPVNSSMRETCCLPKDAYWSTDTTDRNFQKLGLNLEGDLYLFCYCNNSRLLLANSTQLGKNTTAVYRATLDVDGIFRLYAHQFDGSTSSLWSALSNPCDVKGYCGFNSYCSAQGTDAVCLCYPGFVSSNSGKMFLDCKRNHTRDDCEGNTNQMMVYNVSILEKMWWADNPYSAIPMTRDACGKYCQEDCNCGAVLYINGSCNIYKLPLRYGKTSDNASATALFAVPFNITANHTSPPPTSTNSNRHLVLILVLILGSISCFCFAFPVSIFFSYRRQVYRYRTLSKNNAKLGFTESCTLQSFSFDELVESTGSFTEEVGRGSFGAVYKGKIGGGDRSIAVKRLERVVEEGEKEFRAEITAIARTHHRNLVRLIGFCVEGSRKLLVYEYMSNGSLADLLFKSERRLSWKDRVRIALDVARGILYLHEECEVFIIHCNIKPQNILMDEAWTAKISDFGLARLLMPNRSRTTSGFEGKSEYLAPEWQKDTPASVKADIYSYGVILLEIICRRRSIDVNVSSEDEIILSSWVYACFVTGELHELVPDDEEVNWRTLERMMKVGLWCVQEDPTLRPSMKNVILMLEGLKDVPNPPSPALAVQ